MQRQQKIRVLYDAALKVFSEYGYRKTTVEDIADEMGLTKGALYQYVTGKKQLYDEAVKYALWDWQHKVVGSVIDETNVEKRFVALCKNAYKYLSEDKVLKGVLINDPTIFPLSYKNDPYKEINNKAVVYLQELLEQGIKEEKFREIDTNVLARILFSIYKMFIIETYIFEGTPSEVYINTMLDILINGFYKNEII